MVRVSNSVKRTPQRRRKRLSRLVKAAITRKQCGNEHLHTVNLENQAEICEEDNKHETLRDKLRSWVSIHNISQRAVNHLLQILISVGFDLLPKDCRTLMNTPQNMHIRDVANGKYWFRGLLNGIKSVFRNITSDLKLQLNFNIDGLPIFNSSPTAFWPILADIHSNFSNQRGLLESLLKIDW